MITSLKFDLNFAYSGTVVAHFVGGAWDVYSLAVDPVAGRYPLQKVCMDNGTRAWERVLPDGLSGDRFREAVEATVREMILDSLA